MSSRSQRSTGIEALRGVAALMVLSLHATSLLVPATDTGVPGWHLVRDHLNSGLQLFFVIRGFLIAGPYIRDLIQGRPLPAAWPYALRRVARIGPAFWAVLLVFLLITTAPDGWSVLVHATFTHDLVPHQSGAILPVAWTLGVEALFYAFVPIAAGLIRWRRPSVSANELAAWVLIAWALSVAWELAFSLGFGAPYGSAAVSPRDDTVKLFTISLPGMFNMFCPGLLVAIWRVKGARLATVQRHAGVTILAGCGLWLVAALAEAAVGGSLGACLGDQLRGLAFAAVLLGAVTWHRAPGRMLRLAAALGVISYGLYLWHWLVTHGIEIASGRQTPFGGALGTPAAIVVTILATLPFALASWVLIESPSQRWAAAVARRQRSDQPAVALSLESG